MEKIFLAGDILNCYADETFKKMIEKLNKIGYTSITIPFYLSDIKLSWEDNIKIDIKALLDCTELHLLPCWINSKTAEILRDIAKQLSMKIVYH